MVKDQTKRGRDNIFQPWWIEAGVEEGIEKEKEIARSLFTHVQEPGRESFFYSLLSNQLKQEPGLASFFILCCKLKQQPVNPGHVKPKGFCVIAELILHLGLP